MRGITDTAVVWYTRYTVQSLKWLGIPEILYIYYNPEKDQYTCNSAKSFL